MKVLVTPTSFTPSRHSASVEKLQKAADVVFNPFGRPLQAAELAPLLADCDGFIAGLDFITEDAFKDAPKLKVISRYGSGTDRVALDAAAKRGIAVCNTPRANTNAAADLAFALILALARKIVALDNSMKSAEWLRSEGMELAGKTLGILGLGAVGKAVARRARGFDMKIIASTPHPDTDFAQKEGIDIVSFDALIAKSDILTLHLPLNEATKGCVSRDVVQKMKRGAFLINTARGPLVDIAAVHDALQAGQLGGFGVDVYAEEPPGKLPIFSLPNVVATPHTGAHTAEAERAMAEGAVQNLLDVLAGKLCANIVNLPLYSS